jgi:hypothetical protein
MIKSKMSLRAERSNPRDFAIASSFLLAMTEHIIFIDAYQLNWEASNPEIVDVAEKFIFANCYNPQVAGMIFRNHNQ